MSDEKPFIIESSVRGEFSIGPLFDAGFIAGVEAERKKRGMIRAKRIRWEKKGGDFQGSIGERLVAEAWTREWFNAPKGPWMAVVDTGEFADEEIDASSEDEAKQAAQGALDSFVRELAEEGE